VFLELACGEVRWLHPLDLDIRRPVEIMQRLVPPLSAGGPAVKSPSIDVAAKTLSLDVQNNDHREMAGTAEIRLAGTRKTSEISIPVSASTPMKVDLAAGWNSLSPGSQSLSLEVVPKAATESAARAESRAILWDLGPTHPSRRRMRPVDLAPHCNADMAKLFSPATQWRIDYTGCQHGVDRRLPQPPRDELGYVLLNSVMSVFEYGTLQEQVPATKRIEFGPLPERIDAPVPFQLVRGRLLAVCRTEPHEQFPSRVTLLLDRPMRIEKVYLLTANIVKTLKCYTPAAEVVLHFGDGASESHPMIPPYTMPSVVGHICPAAHAIRVGKLVGGGNPVADTACTLSITDVVVRSDKPATAIELRSVATETLLGVAGITLLEREN
jgi:hypothetical protein